MLDKLHSSLRIDAKRPCASDDDIQALRAASSIQLPRDYVQTVLEATEIEILVNGSSYIRIWGPLRAIEMNSAYEIQRRLPQALAIGDDEGGSALVVMKGFQGDGLYKVGFGALAVDDAEYVAPSLHDLLIEGVGTNVVA